MFKLWCEWGINLICNHIYPLQNSLKRLIMELTDGIRLKTIENSSLLGLAK